MQCWVGWAASLGKQEQRLSRAWRARLAIEWAHHAAKLWGRCSELQYQAGRVNSGASNPAPLCQLFAPPSAFWDCRVRTGRSTVVGDGFDKQVCTNGHS